MTNQVELFQVLFGTGQKDLPTRSDTKTSRLHAGRHDVTRHFNYVETSLEIRFNRPSLTTITEFWLQAVLATVYKHS